MKVLQNKHDIAAARKRLDELGISAIDRPIRRVFRKLGLANGIAVGDLIKSWDVLETINFLRSNVEMHQALLDIGAYASEMVVSLHRLGYENVAGIDLDPRLKQMPFSDEIRYEICNFKNTSFADGSFKAVTAISVIEHGYDGDALFREVARLLEPGGFFIASFDYWRAKIDTVGIKLFGMTWTIFSEQDVREMIATARRHGLNPIEDGEFGTAAKPVNCCGRQYTFGWLVLQKDK